MLARNAVKLLSRFAEVKAHPPYAYNPNGRAWEATVNGVRLSFLAADESSHLENIVGTWPATPNGRQVMVLYDNLHAALRDVLKRDGGREVATPHGPVLVSVTWRVDRYARPFALVWLGARTFSSRDCLALLPMAQGALDAGEYAPLADWLLDNFPDEAEAGCREWNLKL